MNPEALITLAVLAAIVLALTMERVGPEVVMLAGLMLLVMLGVVDASAAWSGFASESVITLGSLFVVGAGMQSTGALEYIGLWLLGRPRPDIKVLRLIAPVAGLSSILNNTPIVAIFMPLFDLGFGEGAELRQPLGVTVIAGLASATLLTLVFVPVLYKTLMARDE